MAIVSTNPATGEVLKTFDPLSPAEIQDKIQLGAEAFSKFKLLTFAERAVMMNKAADILEADKEDLARLATLEMGKTFQSALAEAEKSAAGCRYYAENAERFLAVEEIETSASCSYVEMQPLGILLAIMPWNYPFWQVFRVIAPTLMAGNVALLKHASNLPQCALKIEEIMLKAGFPTGAFQTLLISAGQVDSVLSDDRVVAATLTGSESAGVQVGMAAARRVKKVVLELGGSDPFVVMPSADLDQAVATAVTARCANNGQSCIAAKRFIVAEEIADEFEQKFVAGMQALKVGDPMDPDTDVGPLASAESVKTLDRDVRATIDAGARVLTGGKPIDGPGCFYEPTVLVDIPKDSPGYSEEFFGPVATLFRVKDVNDAIRVANDTRFGLGASVWTHDVEEQKLFARDIEAGAVFINAMVATSLRMPFGGVKWSGHGRELGVHGIREFTNVKTVWIK